MEVRCTYQYKLYQCDKLSCLNRQIDIAAEIWNHCIALHRRYYKWFGKHLSANRLKVFLTSLKKMDRYAHWRLLGSQAIQDIVERIGRAYDAFFDHLKKKRSGRKAPPRFRKQRNYRSFTLKQAGYKFHDGNHVTINGVDYKYAAHRPFAGTIKTLTVKRNAMGEFFIFLSCIQEWPDVPARTGKAVGIDFGLKHFLTLDNGRKIDSPVWYKSSLNEIRKAHRSVSRCKKGSGNRKRALMHLDRVHEKVSNRRKDWFFKLANELTSEYAVICIEDLNLDAMKQLWGRKVSDYAFAEFVSILDWVALKNGCQVIKIDRWTPSSKACHVCGVLTESTKDLRIRTWTCPACGTVHDRDVNAAINIRNMGLSMLSA